MPNRVLRDWTESEKIDMIDVYSERFFTRLIMKVDDFGRYSTNLKLLKSTLFPLKSDVRETDITRWLNECEKAGLIALYDVAGKGYVQINDFKQVLRQKKEKYPPPKSEKTCLADDKHMISRCMLETKGNESEKNGTATHVLENSNLFRKPNVPSIDDVKMAFRQRGGSDEMALKFFEVNEGTGWFYRGSPITNFVNFIPGYIASWHKNSGESVLHSGITSRDQETLRKLKGGVW